MTPVALTIAGSDPSGGAGLQADLKTFHQHGVYGMSVVTLLTVQNTQGVTAVEGIEAALVGAQFDAIVADIPPGAAKTGALGSADVIAVVAERLAGASFPAVVDPVMVSKHGAPLLDASAVAALRERLLPRATLVTPNMAEAAALAGMEVADITSMERAARAIAAMGPRAVLVKGGRLTDSATDVLLTEGRVVRLDGERVEPAGTHGSGCVLSAAIAARLARGASLESAVRGAKAFVARAIRSAPGVGTGIGPTNMLADAEPE